MASLQSQGEGEGEGEGGGGGGGGGGRGKSIISEPISGVLNDDVLGEILLRLPTSDSLARAAVACKRWRRVASSPVLLRCFHSLRVRLPPLLGVILSDRGNMSVPYRCPTHVFVRALSGDRLVTAASCAGDFLFSYIPQHASGSGSGADDYRQQIISRRNPWILRASDGGLLLLSRSGSEMEDLAVYDPIGRTATLFRGPGRIQFRWHLTYALVVDEVNVSFRVIAAQFYHGLVTAAVYSSRTGTGQWSPLSSLEVGSPWNARDGVHAGRFAYWQSNTTKRRSSDKKERTLVLDTNTMEWSLIEVPFPVGESYCAADMAEHRGLCLVASTEQCLQFWVRNGDGDWVVAKQLLLLEFPFLRRLRIVQRMKRVRPLAVRGDFVLMEFWSIRKSISFFILLNLKFMVMVWFQNMSREPFRGSAFPVFMSWAPPFLSPHNA
ncbi:hypothetical protein GUJ93_ZPchr0013g35013 [Zizania palustris]|uniref:F-box domain-containing protein n=1 Tax=Zizania palustris TaxID=103762 RepID=A0A8J6BXW4_ZIZPA|nr:hypothetical protein GUJ93_ZPchr0013g36329 [Zizania palustris]KAG8099731.1 hypothetical protein GUJ93_ZPchr0013g33929 [Zizania palustris]KAG8099732.1 hypothetical protein GUJ93_ZPchr0013g35013 [Zizania palustris]